MVSGRGKGLTGLYFRNPRFVGKGTVGGWLTARSEKKGLGGTVDREWVWAFRSSIGVWEVSNGRVFPDSRGLMWGKVRARAGTGNRRGEFLEGRHRGEGHIEK